MKRGGKRKAKASQGNWASIISNAPIFVVALVIAFALQNVEIRKVTEPGLASIIDYRTKVIANYSFNNDLGSSISNAPFEVAQQEPTLVRAVVGRGLKLDRDEIVRASSSKLGISHLDKVDALTLSFWINARPMDRGLILHDVDTRTKGYRGFSLAGDSRGIEFWAGGLGGDHWLKCPITNFANEWHHITLTARLRGYKQIYVDGELCGVNRTGLIGLHSSQNLFIGSAKFQGTIDEFKIWKRILKPMEIAMEAQDPNRGMWPVEIANDDSLNGVFSPSVEYDENGVGWMVYTGIELPALSSIKLARSRDFGKTWEYVKTIVDAYHKVNGVWRHETPSLVYDPTDTGKEWKLFWHKYFMKEPYGPDDRVFKYGWIAYQTASSPDGEWSEEKSFFGAGPEYPQEYDPEFFLNWIHPGLSGLTVLSSPGAIVKDDELYLSLVGHFEDGLETSARIVLLKSHNHGENWEYMNTLLEPIDAEDFGGKYFSGSSLVEEDGRYFLLATPENPDDPIPYKGTVIIEFEDFSRGIIKRGGMFNKLEIHKIVHADGMGGQSDYDAQNYYGGILMPHIDASSEKAFMILNTGQSVAR